MNCHLKNGDKAVYKRGDIVISTLGHDIGEYLVVLEYSDKSRTVIVSDGRLKKVSNPKKKNIKHIKSTGISTDVLDTVPEYAKDANIRRAIKQIKAFNANQL